MNDSTSHNKRHLKDLIKSSEKYQHFKILLYEAFRNEISEAAHATLGDHNGKCRSNVVVTREH